MTRTLLSSIALFAFVGCATPTSGDYLFEAVGDATTDCEATEEDTDAEEAENEPVAIEVNEDATEMTYGEGDGALTCPLDGTSFLCSFELEVDYNELMQVDAVVNFSVEMDGKWATSSKITGTSTGGTSCTGEGCDEATMGEFCTTSQDFEATLQE